MLIDWRQRPRNYLRLRKLIVQNALLQAIDLPPDQEQDKLHEIVCYAYDKVRDLTADKKRVQRPVPPDI